MTSSKTRLSPKTQEIFQSMVDIAVGLGPDAKLPTVQQLRRDFGVSIATLDGILSHLESQNVIYRRQGSGIYVSPYLHKKTVGLVCAPEYFSAGTSPFWSEIVEDVRKRASQQGEVFRFYLGLPSGRSEVPVHEDLQDDVASRRLDGVFFIGHNPEAVQWLESQNVAVVNFAGRARYQVGIDYENLIDQAIDVLSAARCQRLSLMSPFHYREDTPNIERSRFPLHFEESLKNKGFDFFPSLVWDARNIAGTESQTYQEQGFEATYRFFDVPPEERPDGLIVIDDMVTRGVLMALQRLGVQPGRDVKLVSHTNRGSAVLQGHEHELTALEIDPAELVQSMFEMLEALMNKQALTARIVEVKARMSISAE